MRRWVWRHRRFAGALVGGGTAQAGTWVGTQAAALQSHRLVGRMVPLIPNLEPAQICHRGPNASHWYRIN